MSDIGRVGASSAIERASRLLVGAYTKETGLVHAEGLDKALVGVPEKEQKLAKALLSQATETAANPAGPTRKEIYAFLDQSVQRLGAADVDGNWQLSDSERTQLGNIGQLAVEMAAALKAQPVVAPSDLQAFAGLSGDTLQSKLREHSAEHTELDYNYARVILFSDIANVEGKISGVYTDQAITASGTPRTGGAPPMNTEHTWPKSGGVRDIAALSDLHHLFPADTTTNSRRSSHPFGEVVNSKWSKDGSALGTDKNGDTVFEPKKGVRGKIARALMYVHTMYELPFPPGEAALVAKWNVEEPPSPAEVARNDEVSRHQGNRNPFVDHPELVSRALNPQ